MEFKGLNSDSLSLQLCCNLTNKRKEGAMTIQKYSGKGVEVFFIFSPVWNQTFFFKLPRQQIQIKSSNTHLHCSVSSKCLLMLLLTYRRLSVCVGQNPVDLYFVLFHLVNIYPQVLAHGVWRAVRFWCVVVVICVLLKNDKRKCRLWVYTLVSTWRTGLEDGR